MKRALLIAVILASVLAAVSPSHASGVDQVLQGSRYCDSNKAFRPGPAIADGPSAQIGVHTQVFEPAYARACPRGSGLLTYLGTGEQAGINAVLDRHAERAFGTGDVAMSPAELIQSNFDLHAPDKRNRNNTVNQIPLFVNVEAVAYNLTSCKVSRLNLRSVVLSLIYSGTISKWNDTLLVQDNPGLASCSYPIRVIKRADFAGATLTLKDYMSKRNPQWLYYKQPAQNQSWPTVTNACPALDEDGMADCIGSTQNSIGYLSYHAARLARLRVAYLDNPTSQASQGSAAFVRPSPQGCTDAAASAPVLPAIRRNHLSVLLFTPDTPGIFPTQLDWSSVSLTDAPAGYPLCSFGFAYIYGSIQQAYFGQFYPSSAARTAVDYLWTSLTDPAQSRLAGFDYGRLPPNILDVSRAGLESVRYAS